MTSLTRPDYREQVGVTATGEATYGNETTNKFIDELISYVRGDDWIYVGEVGGPAFDTGDNYLSTYAPLRYRLKGNEVIIEGVIKDVVSGSNIFTIPDEAMRPTIRLIKGVYSSGGHARVNINLNGDVVFNGAAGSFNDVSVRYFLD